MGKETRKSLKYLADKLVLDTQSIMSHAKTEEDLRIGFEKILEPLLKETGIELIPKYERIGAEHSTVFRGRPDAVHGLAIIEYESPATLANQRRLTHAEDQLIDYMTAVARAHKMDPLGLLRRLVGVGFDGETIFFINYRGRSVGKNIPAGGRGFIRRGPYPFDPESSRTLLTYLRSLAKLPLSAENLSERFGPQSPIAPMAVSALVDALKNWGSDRVEVFFNEWSRLYGIVYGEQFNSENSDGASTLSGQYGVPHGTDFQTLLFAVHTYFALLMKFIAVDLITLREGALASPYSDRLVHASNSDLKAELAYIENGGIFAKTGVTNFLEGDFFRWYLDAFSPRLEESIREIARALSQFEPATTTIDPESSRDLLKKLYQYLVPQEVRHKLGEYYTPDWLAEFLMNETGYSGNTLKRFLDPACGSGTFLVLAIQKAITYGQKNNQSPAETAKRIASSIWGFDLNPLAVIASRTNYLFALGDLISQMEYLEIPIYLADSVLWPEKVGQMQLNFAGGDFMTIQTSVGEFHVPQIWVKDGGLLMGKAVATVEEMSKQGYSTDEAMARFKNEGLVFPPHQSTVARFYAEIMNLERQGKNGIWARFLKNAFAPVLAGKFDFVIGNPPWIRWGYLAIDYRKATLSMWQRYGLFSLKGHAARLGGGEKDFSMLFAYASIDYYLKDKGKLGFLITQEVFKSKGAGEGFRHFQLGEGIKFRVLKAHDFVAVQPFEGAANKTSAIILRKSEETTYPVPYTVWRRKKGVGRIPTDQRFEKAKDLLISSLQVATPIGNALGPWQTLPPSQIYLKSFKGTNFYQARRGASTEPYGVYWLSISKVLSQKRVLVENLPECGKRQIPKIEEVIEPDLVFPAVRGSDIERWSALPEIYVLMCQNPKTSEPFSESEMKQRWPRTFGYLVRFKDILLSRGSNTVRELAERTAFYAMFGIGPYTVARFKVVWKRMASDIIAAVISQSKTPIGYKTIIPTDTTSIFACDKEDEAHYICAIINSIPVREFIKSYSSAGRGFGAPSIMQHVGISKFDPKNDAHVRLSSLSKSLHKLKFKNDSDAITKMEKGLDRLVSKLFHITDL